MNEWKTRLSLIATLYSLKSWIFRSFDNLLITLKVGIADLSLNINRLLEHKLILNRCVEVFKNSEAGAGSATKLTHVETSEAPNAFFL